MKIREGQVANRPVYLAPGITVDGTRDVLMLVCDGLKGLPDAVNSVWEDTVAQTCRRSPPAEFVQVRVENGLGKYRQGPQAGLYRGFRSRRAECVRRVQWQMGEALHGHHPILRERLGRIRLAPAIRPGNKAMPLS